VQMAVGDQLDILGPRAGGGQGHRQRPAPGLIVGIHLGVPAHPGVEQQQAAGMVDEVAQAGLDPGASGAGLLGRTK
jgi:hypothetical protein